MNSNITWKIVSTNLNQPWEWIWLSKNKFNKHPQVRKKLLLEKYFSRLLNITQERKYIRNFYKNYFDCVIGELKMRIRDLENGMRRSMI
jgi:hypothetical protein